MRWICWTFALLAVGILASSAAAVEPACGAAGSCADCGQNQMLCAPACCVPSGFNLTPGCCQCQPDCCDNVWATYCQERARWQAFWLRVGADGSGCRECETVGCEVAEPCHPATATPTPAVSEPGGPVMPATPPVPEPPVRQTSWSWGRLHFP